MKYAQLSWTGKGLKEEYKYGVVVNHFEKELVSFIDQTRGGKKGALVIMKPSSTGRTLRNNSMLDEWDLYVGTFNEDQTVLTGFWRNDDGWKGGEGKFEMFLVDRDTFLEIGGKEYE